MGSRSVKFATALVVCSVGLGLLLMHSLAIPDSGAMSPESSGGHMTHAPLTSVETRIDVPGTARLGHMHGLLGCLWLLIGSVALFVTFTTSRVRRVAPNAITHIGKAGFASQRAPPTNSVLLSLVGVSLR